MIFADTSGWFSSIVPSDPHYVEVNAWFHQNKRPILTTDYILDETWTLLRARGQSGRAIAWGELLFKRKEVSIHFLSPDEIGAAWKIFCGHRDKEWSFTDCTSKVVMERLGITTALTFDHHFRQFGNITVVP